MLKHLTDNCIKLLFISVGKCNIIEEESITSINAQFIYQVDLTQPWKLYSLRK